MTNNFNLLSKSYISAIHKIPSAHKVRFLAPETEPFCQFLALEILLTHFDDFWAKKLTFLDCFWPKKLNHFVSF